MNKESIYIDLNGTDQLYLQRFYKNASGEPVLMIHGSIENGKIFYSDSGKGLAPYLADQGFDVFVADLRGRGKSKPAINSKSDFGITETLEEDFPAFINKIKELKGDAPQHWVGHSWGGVLLLAYLAKNFNHTPVSSIITFGSKRHLSVGGLKRFVLIDLVWTLLSRAIIKVKGYLPADQIGMGSDNETNRTHKETDIWVKSKDWKDWNSGFDYRAALQSLQLPPALYLTGVKDKVLGHPTDVKRLADETGSQVKEIRVLGKANGNKHDYGHIDILTHKAALTDHFPEVVAWMKKHSLKEVGK